MVNSKDGTNYFDRLLNNIENKILVKESSHKLSHNSQFTIEVDDFSAYSLFDDQGSTVGTLVFKFFNADISYHSEYEIFKIEQTTFNFYPDINVVEGVSGKITSYVDNNYLGDVDYSLNAFSIELEEGRITANNAILNSDRLKGIQGVFGYDPPKKSPKSKNNFALVSDKDNNIYLIKIIDIVHNNISKNAENFLQYKKQANDQIKNTINDSYAFFINSKYKIKINQKTL